MKEKIKSDFVKLSDYLEQKYGGKWSYKKRTGIWVCNDGIRYVVRVAEVEHGGDYGGKFSLVMYYKNGIAPEYIL